MRTKENYMQTWRVTLFAAATVSLVREIVGTHRICAELKLEIKTYDASRMQNVAK